MPITIKELLLSDAISQVVEKVNFNFDQLILAGGGPPGIQGVQGIAGPIGSIGSRGDHWFVGPSAFGQTADRDGTDLQIQDLFLDPNGDVYKFFEISGSTGWTFSGINLKGVPGSTGDSGGENAWIIVPGATGGAADGSQYIPNVVIEDNGDTSKINFYIPVEPVKNSLFIGDKDWTYLRLQNFGDKVDSPNNTSLIQKRIPKLTIIQNEVNQDGLNGIALGAYGLQGNNVGSLSYGSVGATTDAFNFVNAAFRTRGSDNENAFTDFRIFSPKTGITIEVGGIPTGPSQRIAADINIIANNVFIKESSNSREVRLEGNQNIPTLSSSLRGIAGEVSIFSKSKDIIANYYERFIPGGGNTATTGYVALQDTQGGIVTGSVTNSIEHGYGNVVIGPVNSTQSPLVNMPLGRISPQALAIVRKITRFNTIDAAIRFFAETGLTASDAISALPTGVTAIKTTFSSAITPIRSSNIDNLIISSGLGIRNIPGVTAGGRIAFTNNVLHGESSYVPAHTFHVSMNRDAASPQVGWPGGATFNQGELDYFYAGFDTNPRNPGDPGVTGRNVGIGFANKSYGDIIGRKSSIPIIQSYYRLDPGFVAPSDSDGGLSLGQGTSAPHIYLQPHASSNIGIGFVPDSQVFVFNESIGALNNWATSKLNIAGGVIIGSTANGYHRFGVNKINNGLIIESALIVGATGVTGQFATSLETVGNIQARIGTTSISGSFPTTVLARQFVARDNPTENSGLNNFPQFAFADFRTGIRAGSLGVAETRGIGQLISANSNSNFNSASSGTSKIVAQWSSRGESFGTVGQNTFGGNTYQFETKNYNEDFSVSNFKPIDTISESVDSKHWSQLQKKFFQTKVTPIAYNIGAIPTIDKALYWMGVYYIIPTNKTFFQLDLVGPNEQGTVFHYVDSGPPGTFNSVEQSVGTNRYYLDGSLASGGSGENLALRSRELWRSTFLASTPGNDPFGRFTRIPFDWQEYTDDGTRIRQKLRSRGWPSNFATFEDGKYNGQKFTLHVLDVSPQNAFLFLDGAPPNSVFLKDVFGVSQIETIDPRSAKALKLKSKTKIVLPKDVVNFDIVEPRFEGSNRVGDGHHMGAYLRSNTIYNFVWVASNFGLRDDMVFSVQNSPIRFNSLNSEDIKGRTAYNGVSLNEFILSPTYPQGQDNSSRAKVYNPELYESVGAWVCTGVERLMGRDMWDYARAMKLKRTEEDQQ